MAQRRGNSKQSVTSGPFLPKCMGTKSIHEKTTQYQELRFALNSEHFSPVAGVNHSQISYTGLKQWNDSHCLKQPNHSDL